MKQGPDVFDSAPKVELHLHLEGAIPLDTLWELVEAAGPPPDVPDRGALATRFAYRDFTHFIETWLWMTRFLDSEAVFETIGEAVARSLAGQNIIYAEASISPADYARHGLDVAQIAMAVRRGINRCPSARVALLVDLVRDTGPARAAETLAAVIEVAGDAGIVGITIGGSEGLHPPEPFNDVYRRAADAGLRLTAHAGEAAGPESVWGALRSLGVERIGHGVRAVEDTHLLAYLTSHRVPLEVCPTSNIRTGIAAGWGDHPVIQLIEAGALVTINSDDPTLFDCTLAGEFRDLEARLGDSGPTMEELSIAAVRASFADETATAAMERTIRSWWAGRHSRRGQGSAPIRRGGWDAP